MTPAQVKGLHDWQIANARLFRDSEKAARENALRNGRETLQKEWGNDFKTRLEAAGNALDSFGGKEGRRLAGTVLKDGTRLGDKIEFIRMLANISMNAERAAASSGSGPMMVGGNAEVDGALAQIEKIERAALDRGLDPSMVDRWPHKQLEALYKKAYGGEPIRKDGTRRER